MGGFSGSNWACNLQEIRLQINKPLRVKLPNLFMHGLIFTQQRRG